jgi:adenosine deaminase
MTSISDLARLVPKVDLHCHFTGSISAAAIIELAELRKRPVDVAMLKDTFDLMTSQGAAREEKFFRALDIVASFMQHPGDLAFAVHALARDAARAGALRYVELSVNPTALMRGGMTFVEVRDGLIDGARAALADFDVTVRFIACFLREEPTAYAEQLCDELLEYRADEFIGVGLDGPENLPISGHTRFSGVFARAGKAGFRRTAHLTETAASDLTVCLDELGCDRIDHGYPVMDDDVMVQRLRAAAVPVTCCLTITRDVMGPVDPRFLVAETHPTTAMLRAGIPFSLGTDDGALVNTDIGQEYVLACEWFGWGYRDLESMSLFGLDAAWLDDSDRALWRARFRKELDALRPPTNDQIMNS